MKRTRTITLRGSGMVVEFAMPNLYQILGSNAKVNPMTGRIVELLEGYGPGISATPDQRTAYARDTLLGAMELASLCLVKPKLVLDREPADDSEIGPEAFAHADWAELLALFRGDPTRNDTTAGDQ